MLPKTIIKVINALNFYYPQKCRRLNKNKDFTIISSNCIGAGIYQDLGVQYNTPTAGLFFFPPCYLKFVYNLDHYITQPLVFIKESKYIKENVSYPIGLLGDVEIHFLHYKSEHEASDKWQRRIKRINFSNMYFIFTDQDSCTYDDLEKFDKLKYENKICFVSKDYPNLKSAIWVKDYTKDKSVGDLYTTKLYRKYLDVVSWLNKAQIKKD